MANRLYDSLYREAQVALAKTLQGEESQIVRYYGTALAECRRKLEALYRKYGKDGRLTNADMSKYNRLSTLQDDISGILEKQLVAVDAMTKRLTGEQYQEAFYRHAYAIDQAGGMSLSWGQVPQDAVRAVVESPLSKLAGSRAMAMSRKGTVDKVRDELSMAVIRGDSYEKLAQRVSDVLGVRIEDGKRYRYIDKGAAYRSMLVARTEGQRVLVDGQMAAYDRAEELGCEFERVWDATLDGRTRAEHGALDGKAMDEAHKGWFVPSIGWVSGPLHSGVARFDINCRCRVVSEIKALPPEERHARGDGVRPYCTYEQWKESLMDRSSTVSHYAKTRQGKLFGHIQEKDIREEVARAVNIPKIPKPAQIQIDTCLEHVSFSKSLPYFGKRRASFQIVDGKPCIALPDAYLQSKRAGEIIRHEIGHAIDVHKGHGTFYSQKAGNGFLKVVADIVSRKPDSILESVIADYQWDRSFSDLAGILTSNRIYGKYYHLGDEILTIQKKSSESFANLFDLYCRQDEQYKFLNKEFPALTSEFERIIVEP